MGIMERSWTEII